MEAGVALKSVPRSALSLGMRKRVRAKTAGRCHVCGGPLGPKWHADHVLPRARGGDHASDNYLPACYTCNRARWHWNSSLIRRILRFGIFARREVRGKSSFGKEFLRRFRRQRAKNLRRRRRTKR